MSAEFIFAACRAPLARCHNRYLKTTMSYVSIAPEEVWLDGFTAHVRTPATVAAFFDAYDNFDTTDADRFLEAIEGEFGFWAFDDDEFAVIERAVHAAHDGEALNLAVPEAAPLVDEVATWLINHAKNAFSIGEAQGAIHHGELVTGGFSFGDDPTDIFTSVAVLSYLDYFTNTPVCTIVNGHVIADRDLALDELPADAFDTAE